MPRSWWQNRALVLCLALIFSGASATVAWAGPLVLTAKDSGRTVTVTVGQRLVVDLSLGAGQHVVAPEFNPEVLALVGQSLQSTTGPQGSSSRVIYEFFVRQGGQTDLVIAVRGSGEKPSKPRALLKVKIIAAEGGQAV
jgi:hypothetical protein